MMLLILYWLLYFVLHSVLASLRVKARVKASHPGLFRYYRLVYNVFAFVGFILIMIFQGKLPPYPIVTVPEWVLIVGYALIVAGMTVISASFKKYDTSEFLGTKIMSEFNLSATPLITTGLNAYVRHPIYFGTIVALIGYLLISFDYKTLTFFVIAFVYIIVGAKLEERKLLHLYGNQYVEYKRRVKMLTPFI